MYFVASDAKGLNAAIECTAETYRDIGTMHSQQVSSLNQYFFTSEVKCTEEELSCSFHSQPKKDTLPALDVLKEYLGILHEFPDTTDIHRRSLSKIRECERMKEEGRIDVSSMLDIVITVWL